MLIRRAPKPKKPPAIQTVVVPAPVGGLNARDSLALMPPTDAITLDNFFPSTTSVDLRAGFTPWSTGYANAVESLMTYNGPTGSKLFAASGTAFYDATASGAHGAAVVSGLANARWQHVNMGTPGGQFLYCVNGTDYPELYNGTAWAQITTVSAINITGVDPRLLIHANIYANRVFFVQKDSTKVWYLPVNSVGGAAASLDFGPLMKLGGYMMAMATWTIDNADGVREYAVFITSEGEVIMYSGTDPSTAADWVKNGIYVIGKPIGRRCFVRIASDLILITNDGFIPLSRALLTDRAQQVAISDKIVNMVDGDIANHFATYGWQPTYYPKGSKLVVNVPSVYRSPGGALPSSVVTSHQYVMNTVTGAWCRFTNWNATVFETMGEDLYFGGSPTTTVNAFVAKCDTGYSDNGAYIFGEAKTAFQYFGAPGVQKQITMVRPIFRTGGNMTAALAIDMDFADNYPTQNPSFSGGNGVLWNTTLWNTVPWSPSSGIKRDWQGVTAIGDAGALHMRVVNNRTALEWQSIQYIFRVGGVL